MHGRRKLAAVITAMSIAAIAVGIGVPGAQGRVPVLASTPSWVIAQVPQPPGGGGFEGVSCATVKWCLAVGYRNAGPGQEPDGTLAERWNGTAWTIQPTPNPAGFDDGQFSRVSCTSAIFCMAVGFAHSSPDTYRTLAEAWNGTAWTIEPTPTPGAGGHLDSVSCTSSTNCIAGGLTSLGQLAEQWNGSAWTVMPLTELSAADLGGISCTLATSCTAVGIQLVSGPRSSAWRTLAEHWDGSTWTIQTTPNPGGNQDTLDAVSCVSTTSCVSVGSDNPGGQNQYAFSASWNGTTWAARKAPYRTGTNGDYLTGITCFTGTNCIAAGFTQTGSATSGYATLVDHWNGSSWTTRPSPVIPAGEAFFEVNSSSCASVNVCAAVGGYGGPGGLNTAFIMQTTG
jgi:hypothetical protein